MSSINNFLLIFDHAKNELLECQDFGQDVESATAAYAAAEREYQESHAIDIVLVGSDSIETVRLTHSTYFKNGAISLVQRALL